MSPARQADPDPDTLIDEITVDSHDEDEHLMGFETAFDEDASFPCHGTVIGKEVEVLSVSRADNRSGSSPAANAADAATKLPCSTSTSTQTQTPHVSSPYTAAGPAN